MENKEEINKRMKIINSYVRILKSYASIGAHSGGISGYIESLIEELNNLKCLINGVKNGVITKEEFKTCLLGMSLKIKENYEKSGFRTDYFPMQEVKK